MLFSGLAELQGRIEDEGLDATTELAKENIPETLGCLMCALEGDLNSESARRWGAFAVIFETLVIGTSGCSSFTLMHAEGETVALDYVVPEPRAKLHAPLREMLYICAGTQRDSSIYRGRILQWQGLGVIHATGDQMLVQALQGMFV